MLETFRIPEGGQSSEYWNGHSFDDDCAWIRGSVREAGIDWGALRREGSLMEGIGKKLLLEYRDLPEPTPVKSFARGDHFNAASYPPGTILRIEEEATSPHTILAPKGLPHYHRWTRLGVVVSIEKDPRVKNRRGIVHTIERPFRENEPGSERHFYINTDWADLTVGEVVHSRSTLGGIANRWGALKLEKIERINRIQILKYGEGILLPAHAQLVGNPARQTSQ